MQYRVQSISRKITSVGNITITIVVFFPKDNTTVYRHISRKEDETVQNVDLRIPSILRLEFPWELGGDIQRRTINLTYIGKIQLIYMIEAFIKMLREEEVFITDPELGLTVVQNIDKNGKSKWVKYETIGKNLILLYPKVIYDESTNNKYEGVSIAINSPSISVNLTVSELCILNRVLNDIDIFIYGQLMIQMIKEDFVKRSDLEQEEFDLVTDKLSNLQDFALKRAEDVNNEENRNITIGGEGTKYYRH